MDEEISSEDRRHLAELGRKLQVVKDRVVGVARRRHTGFFLGGRGGIGKSHAIEGELDRLADNHTSQSVCEPRDDVPPLGRVGSE